jgi:hypothetical protein
MPTGRTVQGNAFEYSGSLATGIVVLFHHTRLRISPNVISVIRAEIEARNPVLMGSCNKPLVPDSVGETLSVQHHVTPQVLTYVVPLLIEEGFCTVNDRKPFIISVNKPELGP